MIAHPEFLLALPALALPFLVRWIRPPKPRRVGFSQMAVLDKVLLRLPAERRRSPWPLHLIRMASVLALLLLAGGLYLLARGPGGARRAAVFLVDDTWHARTRQEGGATHWDLVRARLEREMGSLPLGSGAAVLGFSGRSSGWGEPAGLRDWLRAAGPAWGGEDWPRARRALKELARGRGQEGMDLVVVSAGLAASPEGLAEALAVLPKVVRPRRADVDWRPLPDHALSARVVASPAGILVLGGVASPAGVSGGLGLAVSGPAVPARTRRLELAPGGIAPLQWEVPDQALEAGVVELQVEDGLDLDDRVYFAGVREERRRLVLLDRRGSLERLKDAGYYLREGLRTLEARGEVSVEERAPGEWTGYSASSASVALLHDPPFLSKAEADHLLAFCREGGDAILVAGPATDPELMDRLLGEALPARLKEIQPAAARLQAAGPLASAAPRVAAAAFRGRWLLYRLGTEARVLLRFQDGAPFWVSGRVGRGRLHVVSSPFSLAWSDAVVLGDFPRFLREMLALAADGAAPAPRLEPGKPLPAGLRAVRPLLGPAAAEGAAVDDGRGTAPGLYLLSLADGREVRAACNFDAASEPARRSLGDLAAPRPDGAGQAPRERLRLDRLLAFALGFLLVGEALYLLRRRNRRAA